MRLLPYGDRAVLVETDDDGPTPLALRAAVDGLPGVLATVPAARTLLLHVDPGSLDRAVLAQRLRAIVEDGAGPGSQTDTDTVTDAGDARDPVVLPVVYGGDGGPDLVAVAGELGLDPDGLVRLHAAGTYRVAFCGFAPGFAYLDGLDGALHARRLPEPRTSVPAGSVGIAGAYTGVYPRASPGGWRVIGRTTARLWRPDADPPAVLTPGTPVRFEPA